MRIAMIGSRGLPASGGGVETVVEQLSAGLVQRGHEVLVYARPHYTHRRQPDGGWPRGLEIIHTRGFRGKHLDAISHTFTACCDCVRRGVDVVHVHSPGPALLSFLPAMRGIPILLTVHAPDWQREKWSLPAKTILWSGLKTGVRFASAVTTVSLSLKRFLADTLGVEAEYLPNGAPQPLAGSAVLPAPRGLTGGYALYVARLVPEKRLDLLLRAWKQVPTDRQLVVVGDSNEKKYIRHCRELADERVVFLGSQSGETLTSLFAHADLVVQPSVLEGMPLVVLEAAAYGKCVLASNIAAHTDTLGEGLATFLADDEPALAQRMAQLLLDPQRRQRLGAQAQQWVAQHRRWSDVVVRLEEILQQLVEGRRT